MGSGLRLMMKSLTVRLLAPLVATVTGVLVVHAVASYTNTRARSMDQTVSGAKRTSELIIRATHYGMLLNRKEEVHHTIRQLAKGPEVAGIRVYDKQGNIIFSANPQEAGQKVDLKAEACNSCHAHGLEPVRGPPENRTRVFKGHSGGSILGLITPIKNEPECSNADCHAHPADRTILGVLDVQMSMTAMEQALDDDRRQTALATLVMVLFISMVSTTFVYRVVRVPALRMYAGTERVAAGDLDTHIPVTTEDELGRLAQAFNRMTDELRLAREKLRGWSRQLEQQVADKTAELKLAQRHVLRMEKMASLGKLSATVAHELNNPLAGVLNYTKLMERMIREDHLNAEDREELLRYVGLVQKESSRCGNIVRNMLLFARQSGLEPAPAQLNDIVRRSLMLVEHHLQMARIHLDVTYIRGDDRLVCDAGQVQQALVALLVNAIEIMEPGGGGTLTVSLRGADEELEVAVSDTGGGIPPDVLEHIFEPFFSTKSAESGVGLGLAVVYGIMQRHGYRIDVTSKAGEGTTFRLHLTRTPDPDKNRTPSGAMPAVSM